MVSDSAVATRKQTRSIHSPLLKEEYGESLRLTKFVSFRLARWSSSSSHRRFANAWHYITVSSFAGIQNCPIQDDPGNVTDRAHGWLAGPATVRILEREFEQFGKSEYVRLAGSRWRTCTTCD